MAILGVFGAKDWNGFGCQITVTSGGLLPKHGLLAVACRWAIEDPGFCRGRVVAGRNETVTKLANRQMLELFDD
jgi:hypothetical protein